MGGISNTTTEADLHKLFSDYGNVRATKIISDRGGASKGYGFVTFETEEEAKKLQDEVSGRSAVIAVHHIRIIGTPILRPRFKFHANFLAARSSSAAQNCMLP